MESPVTVVRFPDGAAAAPIAPKLCRDCRWCAFTGKYSECHAPQNIVRTASLVTGEAESEWHYKHCGAHRQSPARNDNCGIEGNWFEPRQQVVAAE